MKRTTLPSAVGKPSGMGWAAPGDPEDPIEIPPMPERSERRECPLCKKVREIFAGIAHKLKGRK